MFYESVLRFGFYITTSAFIFRDFSSMIILNHRYDDPRDEGQLLYEYKVSSTTWIFSSKTHIFSEALNLWPSSSYTYNQNPCPSRSQFECRMTMTSRDDPNPREDKRLLPSNVQKRKNPFMNGNHIPQTHNQNQPNGGDSCKRSVTGDIQYLRKRTEHILRITTPPPPSHTLSSSSTNTDLESSSVSHNPGDIPDSTITTSAVPSNLVFMSTVPLISSKGMKADRKTFNWLIDAWSTSGEIDAPEKATALLERMEELTWPHVYNTSSSSSIMSASLTPSSIFQPNIQSYTKVMSAYARSGRPDAGILAEDLLNRMLAAQVDRYSSTYPYAYTSGIPFPTAQTFTHVMEAYANSGSIDAAPKVQQLCNQIEQMYLSFLRQEEVVEEEKNHRQRVFPNSQQQHPNYYLDKTHTNFLSLHHQQQIINPSLWEDTQHSLRPTARLYNALINAWAKSELDGAAQMAERCLDRMEEMQAMVGGEDLIPNTFHYNSVIHAWANRGGLDSTTLMDIDLEEDGIVEDTSSSTTTMDVENYKINLIPAERAEGILERIEASFRLGNLDARPNTISYNACIDAWAKSCHEKAGKRAETLLRRMEELYESKINLLVKPNTRSYNSVMNAYSKSRDPNSARNAERIFDEMESLYKAGNIDVKPDFISFATIITAWAKSYSYGKADRVLNIYRHMNDLYTRGDLSVRPNVVIFNSVINACAYTMGDITEQRRAIEIAQMMLTELEKSSFGKPDQVTYGTFLKVCQNQMPRSDSRRRIVDLIFKKCCKEGQVGKFVLTQLKTVANDETHYRDLLGRSMDDEIQIIDLPREWHCNVIDGKRRRRQKLHR